MTPHRPLPSIEALQCFVAAAELLSFRAAARRVALSPNAFSQRIRQAEGQLGTDLFLRTTRRVELTDTGRALLPRARAALEALAAVTESEYTLETSPMSLRIGTRFELGTSWLTPIVIGLRTTRPAWRFELSFGSSAEILRALEDRRVDAIVTSSPTLRSDWSVEPLHDETYAFVAAATRKGKNAQHVLVDVDASLPLARYLLSTEHVGTFQEHILCGTGEAVKQFILAGAGVGVLPEYMIRDELSSKRLVKLKTKRPLLSDTFRLVFHRDNPIAPALRRFADDLRAEPLR